MLRLVGTAESTWYMPHASDGKSYQKTHEKHLEVVASHLRVQIYEGGNKGHIMDHILSLQKMS